MSENQSIEESKSTAGSVHEIQDTLNTVDGSNQTSKDVSIKAQITQSEYYSGPIPHPEIIKKYEEILPGSADRIIAMAEKQSTHRQEMEKIKVRSESRDSFLGVIFAFLLGIGSIAAAIIIAFVIPTTAGAVVAGIFGATGLGTMVTTFLKVTRQNNNN